MEMMDRANGNDATFSRVCWEASMGKFVTVHPPSYTKIGV